ncbi:carbohydrate binding domain-containing protein [Acinetobacter baumannii]|uniref:interleukin-like EMT inducer domain-containing protein n=1 Tax=Acinetobacter baumannii TaxID=470 RepID=UPI00223630B7|nr:interleukin-like EMT inducer domain-containing protein [Acinetobacter baumannii]MDW2811529.1 carbohydrate binding domain-containing protein [Acinetobacter baumannii]UZG64209.1 carbohydrate binding domain-containing protein [Acinetobacter baumannii]
MEGNSSVSADKSDAYVPTYVQNLAETVKALADQIRSIESRLTGVDANLSTNLEGLQSVVQSQGQSITNETTVRAKLVQGVSDDVADLRSQHTKDHAYTIGLIEDHHGEQLDLFTKMRDEFNEERQARELNDERIHNTIQQNKEQSDLYYSAVNQRIDQHDQALDDHTFDSQDWTFDSDEVHFNWSILSAAQEWQLAIGQYLKDAQKQLDDYIKSTEESVQEAVDNANQALENSDIDKILDEMLGKIGSEFLDDALRGELNDYAAQILAERQQRAQEILAEANRRIEEIRNLANTIDREAKERVDSIASEAKIRAEQIANEAYNRTQAIAEEASKRASEISAAIDASSAAIEAKAKELLTSVDQTIKSLDEGYTKRFTAIEDKTSKTVESLEAYKLSNDIAVSAAMSTAKQAVSDNAATLDAVNAFRVEYDSNKGTVAQQIKAIADANSVTLEKLDTLRTDFTNRNKETDEAISKTKSELINYANTISDAQKATAENLEVLSAAYEDNKVIVDGKFAEVTKSVSDANQNITSTAQKLQSQFTTDLANTKSEVIKEVQTQTGLIDGKVKIVSEKVEQLSGQFTGLSDDLAKNVKNTATAQETANTAVSAAESLAQNLTSLKARSQSTVGVRAVVSANGINDWTRWRTTGEASLIEDPTALGGYILQLGNNAGNDEAWVHWNEFIKIDPTKLYRVRARYRRVAGESGVLYLGVACKNADQTKYVTTTNNLANDMGSSNYLQSAVRPALGEWQEVVLYLQGKSAGAATGLGTLENPRTFAAQAEYMTPMFIGNYTVQTGISQLNYIIIEDADSIASANDSTATALDLFKVVTKENEATAERTGILESKVSGTEKRLDSTEQQVDANGKAIADTAQKLSEAQATIDSHSKALTTFATKADLEKSEANQTSQLESTFKRAQDALASATDSDSLISDYNLKDPSKWISHYGSTDPIEKHMVKVTDGKIGPTVFRKDPSHYVNCFNYSTDPVPNDRAYKISFLIRASEDANGVYAVTARFDKTTGPSTAYTSSTVTFTKNGQWQLVEKVWDLRSMRDANPQLHFGFALNHTSSTGWAELQGFKVSPVITANDTDNTIVNSSVLVNYATKSDMSGAIANATTALTSQYKTYTDSKAAEVKSAVDANLTQNYYTKANVDQAVSGGVEKFKASLTNGGIGGRNLLLNSKAERSATNSSTSAETYLPYYLIDGGSLEPNTTYTVSGWFKKTANAADIEVYFVSNVGEHRKAYVPLTSEDYTYFKYTFTTGPNTNQAGYVRVDNNASKDGKVATVFAKLVKLEKGEYATDWAAAEGDLLGEISKVDATIRKDMYTKADTDSAIASGLTNFDAQFVLGGVNLFTGGTAEKKGTNEYLLYAQNPELSEIYAKGQITISFDIKVAVAGRVQVYASNNNPDYTFAAFVDVPTTDWTRMSVTVTPVARAGGTGKSGLEFYGTYNTGRIVTVKNVKIEQGRKASAWSPSKGDIDAGFAGALEATNKVSSNLSQNYYTKAAADQAIAAANTQLEAKVNNNLSNTLQSYYNKAETNAAISSGLSEYRSTLRVGGNNLLKNSGFTNDLVYWSVWGTATREVVTINGKKWLHLAANSTEYFKGTVQYSITGFEPNRDYVLSFDAYAVLGDTVRFLFHQAGDGNNNPQLSFPVKVTTTPERYSVTFKSVNNANKTIFNMHVSGENAKPYDIYISNIKLELGNTPTAWAESSQDILNSASANATKYTDSAVEVVDGKVKTTATDLTKLKSTLGDVQNYTVSSAGFNNGWGGIKDLSGKVLGTTTRGFAITVFNGNNIASHTSYDTYGSTAAATNFVNAVNALADGTYVAITSYDAIGINIATVIPALLTLGGSTATLKQVTGRDAYILIGRKGLGEGQGTELFSKTNGNLGGKQLDYLLQLVNGIPVGLGSSAPSAEAYNLLNTQVGEIDGRLTSASRAVTGLESSMITVKKDIGTAQQTADSAKQSAATAQNGVNETQQGLKDTNAKLSDTDLIARALTNGKLLFGDPTFKKGNNSVGYYDNAVTGRVKVERVAKEADNPTSSPYQLNVTVSNGASPSYGGFVQMYWARANAVFLIKYIIKLPVGFKLAHASNSMGVGAKDRFVGSTEGTGKYETYYRLCQCGATGPFSSGGHVYVLPNGSTLSGTETMTFQLAQIECYDLTDYSDMTPATTEAIAKLTEMANTSATENKAMADKLTQIESSFNPNSPNNRMPDMRDETRTNLWTYLLAKLPGNVYAAKEYTYKDANSFEFIRKGECTSASSMSNGTVFYETNTLGFFRCYVYVAAAKTIKFTGITIDDCGAIYVNDVLKYSKLTYGTYTDCSIPLALGWNKIDVMVANGSSVGGFYMNPKLETLVDKMCPSKSAQIIDTTTASVLNGYTTQAEMNSAIATASTTIKSEVKQDYQAQFDNLKLDRVTIPDTRNANQPPKYYWDNYPRSVVTEFKSGSAVGSPGGNSGYGAIETLVPWGDASGGPIIQKWSSGPESNTRYRQSSGSGDTATWGPWTSDLADTKVKLTEHAQVINGIQAVKGVSIDNNGVICGYALTSELVNGVVRTAFGVDVDTFYVGKPGDNKKFFSVVNGVTAINDAIIGNLSASKITTGQFTGDRIAARTLKADHLSAEAIDAIAVSARNVTITAADGSKTVQTGGLTEIFYPNGQLGIRIGIR